MKRNHRLRIFLAGGALAFGASINVSCLSFDRGPGPDDELFANPAVETDEAQWEVHSGLGTVDEFARTGGVDEEAFWRANAADSGVAVLPSGLQYRVIRSGDGPLVGDAPRVAVSYVTSALSGTRVADSRDEGGPVELEVARMNSGWREAVPKMREGAIWRLYVPAALGRSSTDIGRVKSRIYDVEIIRVITAEPLRPEE
jgi:FKBP-type peptidyl-prolyl cis-trans isomerase